MAWVKLHTDILGDPKLMRAERKGAKHLMWLPWLIAFAKHADDDGRLSVNGEPAEPDDIAHFLPNCSRNQIKNSLCELKSLGILVEDDGFLAFARWDVRAGRASDSKEATRERQRIKRLKTQGHADVTRDTLRDSRNGHAADTSTRHALEVEKEKEKDIKPLRAATAGASGGRPNWVGVLGDDWRRVRRGNPQYATIGKHLKPLHDEHGPDVLRAAWLRFLESPKAQYGIPYFARNFGDFLAERAPPNGEHVAAVRASKAAVLRGVPA